jgi:hypothetical protein
MPVELTKGNADATLTFEYFLLASVVVFLTLATYGLLLWMRERRRDAQMKTHQLEREEARERTRLELEERRLEAEERARYEAAEREAERATAQNSGAGSGGYIVIEMPEKERPMFHDLLKGFEDYAKLKGYHIAFSIDSSHDNRIAFKFTVKSGGFVVGQERVRQDFKEYIDQVRTKDIDELDKMPVITNIEEHNYLVAVLKNRISFLQHSYKLAKTTATYYESLIMGMGARSFPALPPSSVIVQTGGILDSRNYSAVNSQRLIQGDRNTYSDSSVNIGQSFNERQTRVTALDDVIGKLKDEKDESVQKARRELAKARDEIAEYPEPDRSSVRKWLEFAKNALGTAALSLEVTEAVKKLWELFGI